MVVHSRPEVAAGVKTRLSQYRAGGQTRMSILGSKQLFTAHSQARAGSKVQPSMALACFFF